MSIVDRFGIKKPDGGVITLPGGDKMRYKHAALPYVTNDEAVKDSVETIDKERAGEQLGLYSPFSAIDRLQGKYWRFAQTNVLFSRTGHGKTYTLLQLNNCWTEFEDSELVLAKVPDGLESRVELEQYYVDEGYKFIIKNGHYFKQLKARNKQFVEDGNKVIVLNFFFEMLGRDDIIRNLSINTGKSVANLYSSEYNVDTGTYNKLSDAEHKFIAYHANKLMGRPIYYFEISGNLDQIYTTYLFWKAANPDCKFIINIDHAGLIDKKQYQSSTDVMSELAKVTIKLRTDGCMNNIICQMNANILDHTRQKVPSNQHPIITDIHGSNEFGWAVDNAWCFPYRPDVEHFPFYGENKMRTKGLVVASKIKSRHGSLGEVYLRNDLHKGVFTPLTRDEILSLCTRKDSKQKK